MIKLYFFKIRKPQTRFPLTARVLLLFIFLFQIQVTYAQWTRQKNANKRRAEMMNILYQGKMYSFGGIGNWPLVEPVPEVYDPVRDKWTMLAPMPAGKTVTHQGIVVVGDQVWHIGGRLESTEGPLTHEVWIYDISQNKWFKGPDLKHPVTGKPVPWGGGGAALVGRTIHLVGGFAMTTCNSDQDQFHLTLDVDKWAANPKRTTWENKLAPMPIKRNHMSTIVLGGKIYVLGGQFGHDCGGGQDKRYSHVYNPLTNTWTRLTDLPMDRSHCEASVFATGGKIYMVGGDGGPDKVTRFNPEANGGRGSWSNLSALNLPRPYIAVTAKAVHNKLIVTGGRFENSHTTRLETYSAPFPQNVAYKFGFSEDCFSRTVISNEKITVKNLLYTLEGEKNYRLTSNAPWVKISKNASGLAAPSGVYVEATIQAEGLPAGNYKATITAKGTGKGRNFTSASFCVTLKVTKGSSVLTITKTGNGSVTKNPDKAYYSYGERVQVTAKPASGYRFAGWSGDVSGSANPLKVIMKGNRRITANFRRKETDVTVVRINAGGSNQTIKGVTWRGCASENGCRDYVDGGFAYTERPSPGIIGANYNNLNQAIYQTEWTGGETGPNSVPKGATAFSYHIPVKNGQYLVRLYFVELNKNGRDLRKFDIKLEGQFIQKNFDIYDAANGIHKAIYREYPVTISDGAVNLAFIRQVQNAKVSAIEIAPLGTATFNSKPTPNAGKVQTVTANSNGYANVTLNGGASFDTDGYLVLYHWLRNEQHLANGEKPTVRLRVGTHQIKLVIKDNAGAYRTDYTTVIVKAGTIPVKADSIGEAVIATNNNPGKVSRKATTPSEVKTPALGNSLTVKLYPNPGVSGERTFVEVTNGGQQENIALTLFDVTGKLVQTTNLITNEQGTARTEWELAGKLRTGTYLIRAAGKAGTTQAKLMLR
ncbi:Kelch repeat-containing protein [Adhaeribacter radiodurans]|uniref:T9SS type A sorting domain-containing protein n=1 Tax=Adhaeribacter radiodurans TaxID=2745197 RepID=A0A7L7LD61_9BACT|nr:malectin domain-containing carbohydrate-binding protein [Adhaeribacter radiodurans]QMU30465.1 T9SS type A sorting domain-containing protein [Adhaeribacter radiodurans]